MKRSLSALLTLALVLSLIPAVFAAEAATPAQETYTFNVVTGSIRLVAANTTTEATGSYTKERTVGNKTYYLHEVYTDSYGERKWRLLDASDEIIEAAAKVDSNMNLYYEKNVGSFLRFSLADAGDPTLKFALALQAPENTGFYYPQIDCKNATYGSGKNDELYISRLSSGDRVDDYIVKENKVEREGNSDSYSTSAAAVYTNSGDEIVVAIENSTAKQYRFKQIVFYPIISPVMEISIADVNLDLTDAQGKVTTTASVSVTGKNVKGNALTRSVSNNFITYESSDEAVATIDATGKITAVGGGEAKIWAETPDYDETTGKGYKSNEITVTVTAPSEEPEEDKELTEAFTTVNTVTSYSEPDVNGLIDGKVTKATYKGNGAYDLEAPETNSNGGKFLYWAKGLTAQKRILIGKTNILTDYVPGENGKEYLIAVYDNELSGNAEYYNANGQLIPDADETTTVSMPGYGSTNSWRPYGETNIYVADYGKTEQEKDKVTITAVDGTVDGKEKASVLFGTEVTCTAENEDATGNPFKCWKKSNVNGDEIVSVDKTYKFKAWETCTVTAVYEEHTPISNAMKIIIDDFVVDTGVTGVMAEFIGFDVDGVNVVEKGIKFTDSDGKETKIAMTTTDNQFTVIADAGKYVGYAILKSEDAYEMITDGSYTK